MFGGRLLPHLCPFCCRASVRLGWGDGGLWSRGAHVQGSPVTAERVLVVHKTSRLDFERMKQPEKQITDESMHGGVDYGPLKERHRAHTESLREIQSYLDSCGFTVHMRSKETFSADDVKWADVVIAAGGDGNFLFTASKVFSPEKLVVGLNTDPQKSEGFLCLRPSSSRSLSDHLRGVFGGEYREMRRQRIRVRLGSASLPVLALNEVFVGEKDISHSSYYDFSHDGSPMERQKSSGLLLYTGSGSTSWAYNMNKVSAEAVQRLLAIAADKGGNLSLPPGRTQEQLAKDVSEFYNTGNIFEGEKSVMAFTVREPIIRGIFAAGSIRGYARRATVISRSWNATLVIDGHYSKNFPNGSTVECEIHDSDSLRTVHNGRMHIS